MSNRLQTSLVTNAFQQALFRRQLFDGLLHHSDRGSQYTSIDFQSLAEEHGVKLSMSGKGCCYDNAVAESFFHTLKTEHTSFYNYRTREEL